MDWKVEYEPSANFVRATCVGDFTVEDCIGVKKDFLSREFWRPGMNILIDYRETRFNNLGLDDLRRAGDFHIFKSEEIGPGKLAFLMNSVRDYGLARQYELITEEKVNSKMMVFSDEREALEWLQS